MKLELTNERDQKMSLTTVPKPGAVLDHGQPTDKPNYLVNGTSRKSPPGFADSCQETWRVGSKKVINLLG